MNVSKIVCLAAALITSWESRCFSNATDDSYAILSKAAGDSARWHANLGDLKREFDSIRDKKNAKRGSFEEELFDFVWNDPARCYLCAMLLSFETRAELGPDWQLRQQLLERGLDLVKEKHGIAFCSEEEPFRFHLAVGYMHEGVTASAMLHKSLLEEQRTVLAKQGNKMAVPVFADEQALALYGQIVAPRKWPGRGEVNSPSEADICKQLGLGSMEDKMRLVELDCTGLGDTAFRLLQGLRGLKSLSVNGSAIRGESLSLLQPHTSLRELCLQNCYVTNNQLLHLAVLPDLESLILWRCPIDQEGVRNLLCLVNLRELSLEGCWRIDDKCLARIAKLRKIEKLNLRETIIENELERLSVLRELRELNLSNCRCLWTNQINKLKGLDNIEVLDLSQTNTNVEAISTIGTFKRLKDLKLRETPITGKGLVHLNSLEKLEFLDLSRSMVNDEDLKYLKSLKSLAVLELSECIRLSGHGLIQLTELPNLRCLILDGTKVPPEVIAALEKKMPHCDICHGKSFSEIVAGFNESERLTREKPETKKEREQCPKSRPSEP